MSIYSVREQRRLRAKVAAHARSLPPRYRVRRGKTVEVPEEWRGVVTHPQTIRKRASKAVHKLRKEIRHGGKRTPKPGERAAMVDDDG